MTKQKSNKIFFFQQKYFWSEPKTFEIFSGVSFVKKTQRKQVATEKNLIKIQVFDFFLVLAELYEWTNYVSWNPESDSNAVDHLSSTDAILYFSLILEDRFPSSSSKEIFRDHDYFLLATRNLFPMACNPSPQLRYVCYIFSG